MTTPLAICQAILPIWQTSTEAPVDVRVRRRLRELRTEQGLTLQQVAEQANLDVSTLSRLESGKRRLALDHLPALAAALGVSADELLGSAPPQDPRVRGQPPHAQRPDDVAAHAAAGPRPGCTRSSSCSAPKRRTPPKSLPVHEGHDWLYVLDGRMRLVLGDDDLTIEPGEAVEFSTLHAALVRCGRRPGGAHRHHRAPRRAAPPPRVRAPEQRIAATSRDGYRRRLDTQVVQEDGMERLAGKVAFITGAARGQGPSRTIRLASEGADVSDQ